MTILSAGIMQIGWASSACDFEAEEGTGVGDDTFSFAFDGCRELAWHSGHFSSYGQRWQHLDVVGCKYDGYERTMSFSLNGIDLGVAFSGVTHRRYFPAVSLSSFQHAIFNFGNESLRHLPAGYVSISEIAKSKHKETAKELLMQQLQEKESAPTDVSISFPEKQQCIICYDSLRNCILIPCLHNDICMRCASKIQYCPVCRIPIEARHQSEDGQNAMTC